MTELTPGAAGRVQIRGCAAVEAGSGRKCGVGGLERPLAEASSLPDIARRQLGGWRTVVETDGHRAVPGRLVRPFFVVVLRD